MYPNIEQQKAYGKLMDSLPEKIYGNKNLVFYMVGMFLMYLIPIAFFAQFYLDKDPESLTNYFQIGAYTHIILMVLFILFCGLELFVIGGNQKLWLDYKQKKMYEKGRVEYTTPISPFTLIFKHGFMLRACCVFILYFVGYEKTAIILFMLLLSYVFMYTNYINSLITVIGQAVLDGRMVKIEKPKNEKDKTAM